MSAKKKIEEPQIIEHIDVEPLDDVMGDRYGIYAKYVIQDRAIPDARDGLKPVQRRIIYSMWTNNNTSTHKTRKCAKIVGDVIGKYHPHGDTSVYDALARMSQDWKVRMPLITFQGNNGSIDGDMPAAYRYTEAKLSELADELVKDLNKNAVDKALTYDDTEYEPIVLPAKFPNLFVNGSEGIAVALATEIPPHNLKEIIDAIIYRINRVRVEPIDLMQFVKGPDFPTGGIVYSSDGLKNIYLTGKGRIEISAKTEILNEDGINKIIITEIPYKGIKINIVHEIDEIRHNKIIEGIIEVRDESDRHGLKIVVDCKKNVNPNAILNFLMSKTSLHTSYTANIVAIVNGHPKTLNLLEYVDCYIAHQVEVITRVSKYDLEKCKYRLEIVNGLIKAISILDEIISIIRKSQDKQDAKQQLIKAYEFSEPQVEAIVMMPLYKLSHTDMETLVNEKSTLESEITRLSEILNDRKALDKELIKDLRLIAKKYGNPRRTEIKEGVQTLTTFDKRELINKEDVMVSLTRDGYIKRSSLKSYKSSEESLPGVKIDDTLVFSNKCNTEDYLIAFTSKGNYLVIPIHEIPDAKWKDEGKQLNYKITYNAQVDKIVKVFVLKTFNMNDIFFTLISKNGQIKRTFIKEFSLTRCTHLFNAMRLLSSDELVDVVLTTGSDNLLIFLNNGEANYYNEDVLTPIGVKAGGVKAVKLNKSYVVGLLAFKKEEKSKILIITNHGHYRIFDNQHIELGKRLSKNTLIMPTFKNDSHEIVAIKKFTRSEGGINIYALTQLKGLRDFKIDDLYFTPIDKYAKTNLDITKKDSIIRLYSHGEIISNNITSTYVAKSFEETNNVIENNNSIETSEDKKVDVEEPKETEFTQISIFDEDE